MVHVFVTLYKFDLVSYGFVFEIRDLTKDFCLTYIQPVIITYVGCFKLYLTLIGVAAKFEKKA